ncbi:Gfo/Idh/MocA family protein [Marinicrinis sediminis]|uniref:Gfo/Idh/MocA family protein n=1 Tax=Marinicrinis sediminis TaxID=1652465 RepID=A0ABW5RE41_9BACL
MKIAMLSFWHVHAKDYAEEALQHPLVDIAAIWDEDAERGRREAEKRGVPFYASLEEVLALPDIEGVVIDTPTNRHHDVMIQAAEAGKHIFTEKVLAATTSEAEAIIAAADRAGVILMVSMPRLDHDYTSTIKDVLHAGRLGKLTQARVRFAHNGAIAEWLPEHFYDAEACQGGALIDLGCHPVYLNRLFLGMPQSVQTSFNYVTGREVEDQATVLFQYDHGAVGIAETGFVNAFAPFTIEIHGTEGSLTLGIPDEKVRIRTQDTGGEWEVVPMKEARPTTFSQWVTQIDKRERADENLQMALDLTRLMEAAYQAEREKKSVQIT